MAENILRGLAYLHERQIMHRDLKPENVMVDDDFCIRLIDFGLAKQLRVDGKATMGPTASGDAIGTPRYMSPEQFMQAKNLTLATDVWSFGAILYELFLGKPLFEASNQMALGHEIMTRRLGFAKKAIPLEMRPFLEHCLERDASARFANAQVALQEFCVAVDALSRRLRHEYYLPIWMSVFEKHLIERFVAGFSGQFDGITVQKFMEFAKENGISQLDKEAIARVLPPALDAQRAADTASGELEREKARLEKDLKNLSGAQMHERSDAIERLEKKHADALKGVSVEIRRQLANEVKEWDRVQAERAERESRELEEWDRVQAENLERDSRERKKEIKRSRQLKAWREEQNAKVIRLSLELAAYAFKVIRLSLELAAYAFPVVLGLLFVFLGADLDGDTGVRLVDAGFCLGGVLILGGIFWIVCNGFTKSWRPYALILGGSFVFSPIFILGDRLGDRMLVNSEENRRHLVTDIIKNRLAHGGPIDKNKVLPVVTATNLDVEKKVIPLAKGGPIVGKWREKIFTWEFKNDGGVFLYRIEGNGNNKLVTKGTYTRLKDELTTRWDGDSILEYTIIWLSADSVELHANFYSGLHVLKRAN